ncbi:hypothetical protein Vadar_005865 [Vaccinium darrowii]|uniref:Uncharacterized protein n=1 Tax=Vaccinium darrowii TaxID=229202 RepID=A0ACB7Z2U8_9ERIC|nr:hypothetical protein Vadar_005865 [Vaccinium darrowii]
MGIASRPQGRQNPSPSTTGFQSISNPATFVQADITTFKQLVQILTGTPKTAKQASKPPHNHSNSIPPIKTGKKKQSFKLYERRNNLRNGLLITSMGQNLARKDETLSPSVLDFPSLSLSPVTPLIEDSFGKSSNFNGNSTGVEEEKAIAEKGFYLHPSPRTISPKRSEPLLLPLFPVTSPRTQL